jgi:hypothetical protein
MLRLGVDDESDSDSEGDGKLDPDDDGEVELEQEYSSQQTLFVSVHLICYCQKQI